MSVVLGPRSLGLTLRLAGEVMLYADMPRSPGVESLTEAELLKLARSQAARLFQTAAEDLA